MQASKTVVIPPLKALKFIILAMLAGLIGYAGIAVAIALGSTPAEPGLAPLFAGVLAALGASFLAAGTVVSRAIAAKAAAQAFDSAENDRRRLGFFFALTVVKAVFAEAFGLVGTTFLLLTGEVYFIAAPLIAAAALVRLLPREGTSHTFDHSIGPGPSSHGGAIEP